MSLHPSVRASARYATPGAASPSRPSQATASTPDLESTLLFSPGHRRYSSDGGSSYDDDDSSSSGEEKHKHRRRASPAPATGTSPTVVILVVALVVAVAVALYFALRGSNLFGQSPSASGGGTGAAPATTRPTAGSSPGSDESSGSSDKGSTDKGDSTDREKPTASGGGATGNGDASTSAPPPSSTGGSSSSGGPLVDDSLKGHNDFRATHHADTLTWNDTLAEAAQRWVENCVWEHSEGSLLGGGYGENLFMTSSTAFTKDSTSSVLDAVGSWNDEEKMYDYGNPGFTHETGHFTQTIWVGTKSVGCAMGTCMGLMTSGQWAVYYVCEYFPPGNWEGQFPENVLPP